MQFVWEWNHSSWNVGYTHTHTHIGTQKESWKVCNNLRFRISQLVQCLRIAPCDSFFFAVSQHLDNFAGGKLTCSAPSASCCHCCCCRCCSCCSCCCGRANTWNCCRFVSFALTLLGSILDCHTAQLHPRRCSKVCDASPSFYRVEQVPRREIERWGAAR